MKKDINYNLTKIKKSVVGTKTSSSTNKHVKEYLCHRFEFNHKSQKGNPDNCAVGVL